MRRNSGLKRYGVIYISGIYYGKKDSITDAIHFQNTGCGGIGTRRPREDDAS